MILVLLGPPGSGKGTQAYEIKELLNIAHISTGDMLREAIKNNTEVGTKANEYMQAGKLVPDNIIIELINERTKQDDCKNGFMLDGFPRTVNQAKELDGILSQRGQVIDKVMNLEVSDDVVVERLSGRRTCRKCKSVFNVYTNQKPKQENICDKCGHKIQAPQGSCFLCENCGEFSGCG